MSPLEKLAYVNDASDSILRNRRKRMAEDDVREKWLDMKRKQAMEDHFLNNQSKRHNDLQTTGGEPSNYAEGKLRPLLLLDNY